MKRTLFILGAGGYVGRQTVQEAAAASWYVKALVRNDRAANDLGRLGARAIMGNVLHPGTWIEDARGADVMIDLIQPSLPDRLTAGQMEKIVRARTRMTRFLLEALSTLPAGGRPHYFSVSGLDELQPDGQRRVHGGSALRAHPNGFGRIGVAVRRLVVASGLPATFVHLAHVYGPGKAFAERIFPALARGRFPIVGHGRNRLGLIHVEDAARALVHLCEHTQQQDQPTSFVAADGAETTLEAFLNLTASLMGARAPYHVPRWLASLKSGSVMAHELTADLLPDTSALLKSGFALRYPSPAVGLPPTLAKLGLLVPAYHDD